MKIKKSSISDRSIETYAICSCGYAGCRCSGTCSSCGCACQTGNASLTDKSSASKGVANSPKNLSMGSTAVGEANASF